MREPNRVGAPLAGYPAAPALLAFPGCDDPRHREELFSAEQAWRMGFRWALPIALACGCVLPSTHG